MEKEITLKPIGVIHTPYKEPKGIPIQGVFERGVTGTVELFSEYREGLKDIDGFSHIILIYYFNRAREERLVGTPFLEDETRGIFAIRSPMRPNHIGFSIVKLESVENNVIAFSEVDMLDSTPLVSYFDSRENVRNGWLEKYFKDGKIPKRAKLS